MKKLLLILLFIGATGVISAQSDTIKYVYCEIVGTPKLIKHWEFTIRIDSGKLGEPIPSTSMVETLNLMSRDGWEFIQAYVVPLNYDVSSLHDYHYVLRKKK